MGTKDTKVSTRAERIAEQPQPDPVHELTPVIIEEASSVPAEVYDAVEQYISEKAAAKHCEPKGHKISLPAVVAGAVFTAATNETGYMNTIGSHHATKVTNGQVRIELPPSGENDRQTLVVRVPDEVTFEVV